MKEKLGSAFIEHEGWRTIDTLDREERVFLSRLLFVHRWGSVMIICKLSFI